MSNTDGMPMDLGEDVHAAAIPRRGRPRKDARSESARELPREMREGLVVQGRNGEMLSRKRRGNISDPLHVDPSMVPEGWEYQWNTVDVYGNADVVRRQSNEMYANGWRPVPAERHPGIWTAIDYKGPIMMAGCRLDERPKSLCDDAREDMRAEARRQTQDRDNSIMGGKAALRQNMPPGFEMDRRYRGTGGELRMSIDPAVDVPAPQHRLAEPGE